MILLCPRCRSPITRSVARLDGSTLIWEGDGESLVPEGRFEIGGPEYPPFEGHYILNLSDLVNTKPHPDPRRQNGCCGLDGCDGINTICSCGQEIGTERSDCWTPHYIHIESDRVEVIEG